MLKKVEGLENLSNLTTLHLRDNQIETLSGFSKEMKSLQYLNLRYASLQAHLALTSDQEPPWTLCSSLVPVPQFQPTHRFSPHPPSSPLLS